MASPTDAGTVGFGRGAIARNMALFLGPAAAIYTVFSIYPLIDTIVLSLQTRVAGGERAWIGLANFARLLGDPNWSGPFWNALWNNIVFFVVHMAVQNPIAIALAALLSLPNLRGTAVYRTVLFLPTMLSVVIVGFIWQLMLSPLWGVGHALMGAVGLGGLFQPFLGQEETALITLSLISVWQFVGIPLMLVYAALLNIPEDLSEAARVDGASNLSIFWRVKLPLILPTIGLVSILTFVGNFNAFDLIYTVKGALAGPDFSTDILGTLFYRTFFGFQLQAGDQHMGATVATVMFFIILAGVCLYLFGVQRRMNRYTF
jgi:raffinose/stachyose/melibiose transport system permease protein